MNMQNQQNHVFGKTRYLALQNLRRSHGKAANLPWPILIPSSAMKMEKRVDYNNSAQEWIQISQKAVITLEYAPRLSRWPGECWGQRTPAKAVRKYQWILTPRRTPSRQKASAPERMHSLVGGLITALVIMFRSVEAYGPIPRIIWNLEELDLVKFHEPGIFNYSLLLLSKDQDILYVGAREAIFAVNVLNISQKQNEVYWKVSEDKKAKCAQKGKSKETECLNYIRVLQPLSTGSLYVCGTNAFQPICDHLNLTSFKFLGINEDGKGKCPFGPAHSCTSVMVDGQLYSGTASNFFGNQYIISRITPQNSLRTEYDTALLYEPNFVFADVIQKAPGSPEGKDDKVYFFFTEVSVEYEFVYKLKIPRVARVCKEDHGGLRMLKNRWTSFLKAKLICSRSDIGLVFNIVQDVFVLRAPDLEEPIFYALFTLQLGLVQLSAVCAYTLSRVEAVFSQGKYMESNIKWVPYNGPVPTPRPGACIDSEALATKYTSSLDLPDNTLRFIRDHPLMDDAVTPINNKPKFIKKDISYTQIVVDRTQALDGKFYDVMFMSTDRGTLHKAVSLENDVYMIEETQLFQNSEPVKTLLLSSKKGSKFVYAGSNAGVVQVPLAFCRKYSSCKDCVLARDPYCAWNPTERTCDILHEIQGPSRGWIQDLNDNASWCPSRDCFYLHKGLIVAGQRIKCYDQDKQAWIQARMPQPQPSALL
ncbi:semaphorin-4D-like [Perognathus longimembris pacificus]|uniref:semaphorin-4D-like n=1 Tax=Perognathus longimembris pacificus TaxID=214514 RepID=UPI00201950BD|nr:semaphorin-4D-like [Perognathus longimembris pacificus]